MTKNNRNMINEIKTYRGKYTFVNEVKSWLQDVRKLQNVQTIEQLKKQMSQLSYFYPKDFRKVDHVVDYLTRHPKGTKR